MLWARVETARLDIKNTQQNRTPNYNKLGVFSTMINIIVAHDRNRVIGYKNSIPWHLSDDLRLFKQRTTGNIVIMGRNTWESLPKKPLPDRINIVVSKTLKDERCIVLPSLNEAIQYCDSIHKNKAIYIIGGAMLYKEALQYADRVIVSLVEGQYRGDTFFPVLDNSWKMVNETPYQGFVVKEYLYTDRAFWDIIHLILFIVCFIVIIMNYWGLLLILSILLLFFYFMGE